MANKKVIFKVILNIVIVFTIVFGEDSTIASAQTSIDATTFDVYGANLFIWKWN